MDVFYITHGHLKVLIYMLNVNIKKKRAHLLVNNKFFRALKVSHYR